MSGWRTKLGFMIPCTDTVLESDAYRIVPYGISVHFTRMMLREVTPKALQEMATEIEKAAALLYMAEVDVIAFGCTSGSLIMGPEYDKKIIKRILSVAPNVKATTTATAVINALNELNLKKIVVLTPYIDKVNEKEKEFLEAHNFKVLNIKGLGIFKDVEISKVSPETIYGLAKAINMPEADGVFISCTNFRSTEVVDVLEKDLEKPIITSNQATIWDMLKKANVRDEIRGFGKLMERL
ncbi:MAG: maleate cis-trans isomerase [Candidatus Bathyarchaeia archaeon]